MMNMQTKDIHLSEKNWRMLMTMKLKYGYKNIDEIIESLLKIVPASDLVKEKKK